MKIETKYSIGDTVFFEQYGTIAKGKIVDVEISSNRFALKIVYEVNTAPDWYEMFSPIWSKYSKKFVEDGLYSSASEVSDKLIARLNNDIDAKNKHINKIMEQISKLQNND
jgi:hypothetical protein